LGIEHGVWKENTHDTPHIEPHWMIGRRMEGQEHAFDVSISVVSYGYELDYSLFLLAPKEKARLIINRPTMHIIAGK
jgi:hypothetical protein